MHAQAFVSVPPHFNEGKFMVLSAQTLVNEKNLLGCSPLFVEEAGGPVTKAVLGQLREVYAYPIRLAEQEGLSAVVDVYVHKLLPGQYPTMPGWHCDWVPYGGRTGQPDFTLIHPQSFNISLTLSNEQKGVSTNEYVSTSIKPKLWDKENVFKDLHAQVLRIGPDVVRAKDGVFVRYTPKTILKALPCERRGVRLYVRFSMCVKPPIVNELVNCQQVYVNVGEGT
jgi:hypothetical protein